VNIHREKPGDEAAIHEVKRLAFETDDETNLVDASRRDGYLRISLVAEEDGKIVGHVLFSGVSVDDVSKPLALAPVAVVPGRQSEGVGSAMIKAGIKTCAAEGFDAIFVLGEPGYYSRFGFSTEKANTFDTPYPKEYFMALELAEETLEGASGSIEYPPPFGGG
jgi:putative acetyltransferase